jgi:hypothetical protein
MNALTIPTIDTALQEVANAQENALALRNGFARHFQQLHDLAQSAKAVLETEPKKARAIRLNIRAVRCAADKTREDLKADSLRYGKAVQGVYNVLEYQAIPLEEALEKIEKAEELREQARKKALANERIAELSPYMDTTHLALGDMAKETYDGLLAGAKSAHAAKLAEIEQQKIAEAERKQKEADERAERERARLDEAAKFKAENERQAAELAKMRKEQEAKDAAELKERQRQAAEQEKERKETERKLKEAERIRIEESQKAAAALLAEKLKREASEAEAKRLIDEQRKKDAAEAAAAKKAANAPERAKVLALAKAIAALPIPALESEEGKALAVLIAEQITRFSKWLKAEGEKL